MQRLDDLDRADSLAGFPGKLARAVNAALSAAKLSDADQETALAAVESFLEADAAEQAERDATRLERVGVVASPAWWADSRRYTRNRGNGNGRR